MDVRVNLRANAFDVIQANGVAIFNDVAANPATYANEIATRLTLALDLVQGVLDAEVELQAIVAKPDAAQSLQYWTAGAWADLLRNNFAAARNWIDNNNNGLASQMATDLAIPLSAALALLRWFGSSRGNYLTLTPV